MGARYPEVYRVDEQGRAAGDDLHQHLPRLGHAADGVQRAVDEVGEVGRAQAARRQLQREREMQSLVEEVRAMPQVRVLFSADYLAVKDEMETLRAAHISHEEFVHICERHGVSDAKDQDTLLDLLHDLGTVLYFRDADGNPLLPALGVLITALGGGMSSRIYYVSHGGFDTHSGQVFSHQRLLSELGGAVVVAVVAGRAAGAGSASRVVRRTAPRSDAPRCSGGALRR